MILFQIFFLSAEHKCKFLVNKAHCHKIKIYPHVLWAGDVGPSKKIYICKVSILVKELNKKFEIKM